MLQASDQELAGGVVTASAGNMAQGVAYAARIRGVPATIVVPEGAPGTKIAAIERFGGRVVSLPYDEWWRVLVEGHYAGAEGLFVHPVDDLRVMAGNGTIGLELLEDLPDLDAVVVPYGGGGLISGIASAVKALEPSVRVYAAEPTTGAPASATLAAGTPTPVDYVRSFVDGAGSRSLIPGVWAHARELIDGAVAVPLDETAAAVRLIAERVRVIAEGAGALAVAAALAGHAGAGKVVCIVSGGNIDPRVLARILVRRDAPPRLAPAPTLPPPGPARPSWAQRQELAGLTARLCNGGTTTRGSPGPASVPAAARPGGRRPSADGGGLLRRERLLQLRRVLVGKRGLDHGAAVLAERGDRLVGRRLLDDHEERRGSRLDLIPDLVLELLVDRVLAEVPEERTEARADREPGERDEEEQAEEETPEATPDGSGPP